MKSEMQKCKKLQNQNQNKTLHYEYISVKQYLEQTEREQSFVQVEKTHLTKDIKRIHRFLILTDKYPGKVFVISIHFSPNLKTCLIRRVSSYIDQAFVNHDGVK
jgi:hypothetical protein